VFEELIDETISNLGSQIVTNEHSTQKIGTRLYDKAIVGGVEQVLSEVVDVIEEEEMLCN